MAGVMVVSMHGSRVVVAVVAVVRWVVEGLDDGVVVVSSSSQGEVVVGLGGLLEVLLDPVV